MKKLNQRQKIKLKYLLKCYIKMKTSEYYEKPNCWELKQHINLFHISVFKDERIKK